MYSIYCFTNLVNGKKYIGSTITTPEHRYSQHIYNATHDNGDGKYNYPLYQALRKYGIDNFKFEVLLQQSCSEQELRELEKQYIIKFNCLSPNGYNQTLNTAHPLMDAASIKKVSETKREQAKQVAEVNQKQEILHIWRSIVDCAEETGLDETKIAAVCRGERLTTGQRVFYWLDENKHLIIPEYHRVQYKGAKGTTQIQSSSKQVAKIDLKTNEILATYPTIALAARENNCDNSAISKVCRGLRNQTGGYKWQYI
jgi:group I intron endonuclease